jgi:hypothetical protein
LLAYVIQDEARHVAFGRISLKDHYSDLTEAERKDREEFVVDACYLMRDRFRGEEVVGTLDLDVKACAEWVVTPSAGGFFDRGPSASVSSGLKQNLDVSQIIPASDGI